MRCWIGLGFAALALSGCMAEHQQSRMRGALDLYVGKSVAAFAADRGPPTDFVRLTETQASFRWVLHGQGAGAVIPIGAAFAVAPPRQLTCTVSLIAKKTVTNPNELRDWTISSWKWTGAC